ncbi:copper amine oxidase N-terminal domain-containing protein [Cohnella sp. AR92]|uniref:copper amine oxidase N-terminal domain-containing protein n=1 Tax=Cohnella sp. AR92 TaxID=648716 RepID=UPI000F8E7EFA|nr:copper amine oxidase N-terminal domain-containing protein [Cohnella sp. AR92]RUS46927.1 copper amine oxidase N-terminal domain-containing protein [Cohnella sp. AR92]
MKKVLASMTLTLGLLAAALPAYAADQPIKIDGVAIKSDVKAEFKNNRTMVPLRIISENLGAKVNWANSVVTIAKGKLTLTLQPGSATAVKNGVKLPLDVKPYIKNNRVMVPLRFIAETFGSTVNYSDSTVTIDNAPLLIGGVKVAALQNEFHMTMGGMITQYYGNANIEAVFDAFEANIGKKVDAPSSYSWQVNLDVPGSYYKNGQFEFLDEQGKSLTRYDIYTLLHSVPEEQLAGYEEILLYNATEDQWYTFSRSAYETISQLMNTAALNGFSKVISNTIV